MLLLHAGFSRRAGAVQIGAPGLGARQHDTAQVPSAQPEAVPGVVLHMQALMSCKSARCSDAAVMHSAFNDFQLQHNRRVRSGLRRVMLLQALKKVDEEDFFARFTYVVSYLCRTQTTLLIDFEASISALRAEAHVFLVQPTTHEYRPDKVPV